MLAALITSLAFAQAALPLAADEARLAECMEQARTDPASAIANASDWLRGAGGSDASYPQQCLGHVYVSLLRWDAAERAFVAARDARSPTDLDGRARLGAMAGNAALVNGDATGARALLEQASRDAGDTGVGGEIAADMARALVALKRVDEADEALARARRLAPQYANGWLLSAALARRMERMDQARQFIATAAALDPQDPDIGLEAGVIAAMEGRDADARRNWQAVRQLAPHSPQAETAQAYLARIDAQ